MAIAIYKLCVEQVHQCAIGVQYNLVSGDTQIIDG